MTWSTLREVQLLVSYSYLWYLTTNTVAQDNGLAAMERLDRSLDEFSKLLEDKDKQEVPIKQQEALGFVGAVEEAMVKGFPYDVPAQYSSLPQLKVRLPRACQ